MPFPIYVVVSVAIAGSTMAATALLSHDRRLAILAAVVGAGGLALFHGLGYYRLELPLDDAFITMRYSRNLADGLGPNWNSSGRVEGYTTFLWMGTLAGFAKLGADLVVTALVVNALAVMATFGIVVAVWKLWADENPGSGIDNPLVLAPALLALALTDSLGFWGFSGMETPIFMALLTGAAFLFLRERRSGGVPWSAVAFAAVAMTRPEGAVLAAVTGAFVLFDGWRADERRYGLARAAVWGGLFLVLYGSYFLWRYSYYDYLFPNTYYAKVGATLAIYNRGLIYIWSSGIQYQLIALFTGAALLLALAGDRLRRDAGYVIALCGAALLTIVFEGGEAFAHNRFILPILPVLYITGLSGFAMLLKRLALAPRQAGLLVAAVLSLTGLSLIPLTYDQFFSSDRSAHDANRALGVWLNEYTPPDFKIAAFAVGAVAYYANERDFVDLLGLNDVTIAHTEMKNFGKGLAGHEKYNYDYVLGEVKPEVIIYSIDDSAFRTMESLRPNDYTALLLLGARVALTSDPRLYSDYEVRWLVIGDHSFNLLQRRDTLGQMSGPGLLNGGAALVEFSDAASWTPWRSQIAAGPEGLVSSSREPTYGPYTGTSESEVQPQQGETYTALIWVKGSETSVGDQISISLRENGVHSPETESNNFLLLTDEWRPIAVTRTIENADTKSLSIHLIKFSPIAKLDSFEYRDAQLTLIGQ